MHIPASSTHRILIRNGQPPLAAPDRATGEPVRDTPRLRFLGRASAWFGSLGITYQRPYTSDRERLEAFPDWLPWYDYHRPHTGTGGRPPGFDREAYELRSTVEQRANRADEGTAGEKAGAPPRLGSASPTPPSVQASLGGE